MLALSLRRPFTLLVPGGRPAAGDRLTSRVPPAT